MAKDNPFLKNLTYAEIYKLRKYSSYIDKVYDPKTNIVNYKIIIERLKNINKPLIAEEEIFLNNIKRNLQREYWRQGLVYELAINGEYGDKKEKGGWAPSGTRLNKQQLIFDSFFSFGSNNINDPSKGFDNFYSGGYKAGLSPSHGLIIGFFMPEDYHRYSSQHHKIGEYKIPIPESEQYYSAGIKDMPKIIDCQSSPEINKEKTIERINSLKKIFDDINNYIKLINEKEENNNKDEKNEILFLKKEIKYLNEEISRFKKIIEIQNNKIKQIEFKLSKKNNYDFNNENNFSFEFFKCQINQKDEELNVLKTKIENLQKSDKIIYSFQDKIRFVNFVSTDQKIKKEIACLKDELFSIVEERLYKEYPEYKNKNIFFYANGEKIVNNKTIEENRIGNNSTVMIISQSE